MKVLSIEQKAQRYNEALELAKDYFKANQRLGELEENDILSDIFPELKESEDERMRNRIIDLVNARASDDDVKPMIAWLEKQGEQILANSAKTCKDEQKPTDEEMKTLLRTEYEKGRADAIAEIQNPVDCIDCTNSKGCINCEDGNMKETLVQKPAWSEEDECYMSECIGAIATKDGWSFEEKRKTKHWLKSLKDRVQPRRRHTIFDEII